MSNLTTNNVIEYIMSSIVAISVLYPILFYIITGNNGIKYTEKTKEKDFTKYINKFRKHNTVCIVMLIIQFIYVIYMYVIDISELNKSNEIVHALIFLIIKACIYITIIILAITLNKNMKTIALMEKNRKKIGDKLFAIPFVNAFGVGIVSVIYAITK